MMIHSPLAIHKVEVDGIVIYANRYELEEIRRASPNAKVTRKYPKRKNKVGHGQCFSIPVEKYMALPATR